MLLKYFNSNRISVIILFVLLPVIYWIPSFAKDAVEYMPGSGAMPLGAWIIRLNEHFRVLTSIIALLLIVLNGYLLIQLNTVHIFIPYRTQLPLYFYSLLTLSITQLHWLTPALVASTLIILLFYRVLSTYRIDYPSINFLDAGLLVGLASLFYFPAIFFFLCLLITLLLIRPFIWREWVFAIIGLLIPYAFTLSVYYLSDLKTGDLFGSMGHLFNRIPLTLRLSQIINWSYILFFVIVASYFIAKAIDSMKIQARKFFLVFLVFFLVPLILYFIIRGSGAAMVYFVAIPLSYLFTYYFVKCKRTWINDIFFALFLLLLLWQRIS